MGDLVAVMQVGGMLAQFGPPDEILAQPGVGLRRPVRRRRPRPQAAVADAGRRPRARAASPRRDDVGSPQRARRPAVPPLVDARTHRRLARRCDDPLDGATSSTPMSPSSIGDDAQGRPVDAPRATSRRDRRRSQGPRASSRPTDSAIDAARRRTRPMIDWAGSVDHLDDLACRTLQHLELAAIALAVGFVISFALAVLAVRRRAPTARSWRVAGHPVHDPEPGAVRRARPDHRPHSPDGRDPARPVHAGHLRPEHRGGLRLRPRRRPRGRRRHGLHAAAAALARRAAAGRAADRRRAAPRDASRRSAWSRSRRSSATASAASASSSSRATAAASRPRSTSGPSRRSSSRSWSTCCSSRPAAADAVGARDLGRRRQIALGATPTHGPRQRRRSPGSPTRPTGPARTASRRACSSTSRSPACRSLIALAIALPLGLWIGHTRRGHATSRSTRQPRARHAVAGASIGIVAADHRRRSIPQLGFKVYPTLIAMVVLAIPPILVNAYAGVAGVDRDLVEAARGMGMSERQILAGVEMPARPAGHRRPASVPRRSRSSRRRPSARSSASAGSAATSSTASPRTTTASSSAASSSSPALALAAEAVFALLQRGSRRADSRLRADRAIQNRRGRVITSCNALHDWSRGLHCLYSPPVTRRTNRWNRKEEVTQCG